MGRPSILNDELAEAICTRMAEGESLRAICRSEGMPALGSVFRWIAVNEVFREQYEAAMAQRTESMFEEILEIADETSLDTISTENGDKPNAEWISRSRLRVDARKWMLSKMLPKKYGDRQAIDVTDHTPKTPEQVNTRIAELLALAQAKPEES